MSNERSRSRGREFVATGRGGAGNMARHDSVERAGVVRNVDGDERGREVLPKHAERVTHTGRGGAGNIRSPSRDPIQTIREELTEEQAVINAHKSADSNVTFSTGRGGAGNIRKSPNNSVSPQRSGGRASSRDPAPGRRFVSSGRGGAGNLHHANQHTAAQLEDLEEEDRGRAAKAVDAHPIHSSGRGGAGNLTSAPEPHVGHPTAEVVEPTGAVHSSGRGGAGNIINAHKDGEHHHGIGGLLHKVTHPGSH